MSGPYLFIISYRPFIMILIKAVWRLGLAHHTWAYRLWMPLCSSLGTAVKSNDRDVTWVEIKESTVIYN